jgi:hypothetical protein
LHPSQDVLFAEKSVSRRKGYFVGLVISLYGARALFWDLSWLLPSWYPSLFCCIRVLEQLSLRAALNLLSSELERNPNLCYHIT